MRPFLPPAAPFAATTLPPASHPARAPPKDAFNFDAHLEDHHGKRRAAVAANYGSKFHLVALFDLLTHLVSTGLAIILIISSSNPRYDL